MPRKASYPEWVSKYIQKGKYVNKINGNYYLYEAHSERREGVTHPVRVCDGYIGRITQKDGLIPSKKRNNQSDIISSQTIATQFHSRPKPNVWVFGSILAVLRCTGSIISGLKKNYPENASLIYAMSILEILYGESSQILYEMTVLTFVFPNLRIPFPNSREEIQTALDRGKRMLQTTIKKTYGDDWPALQIYLSTSVVIRSTRGIRATEVQDYAPELFEKYSLILDTKAFEAIKKK